jgi:hypothetical protein
MRSDDLYRQLPGDIRIDMTIRKLGMGSPCLDKQIHGKIDRWIKEQEAAARPKGKRG